MVRLAANLSFLFKESAHFLPRFGRAAQYGFEAVEFMFPGACAAVLQSWLPPSTVSTRTAGGAGDGAYLHSAREVAAELKAHGLKQALFNAPAGNWTAGERGLAGLPGRELEWNESVETALRYATELGCPNVHVMAGLRAHGAREDLFVERMRRAADLAAAEGVCLLVEPLNARDFPGYLVPDSEAAVRLLSQIDRPQSCRLQLDLYHMQVSEGDLSQRLRRLLPHAAHVQIANPPGRNEPGQGEIFFPPLLALLDELEYPGYVGLEYRPSTTTVDSLAWASELLRK